MSFIDYFIAVDVFIIIDYLFFYFSIFLVNNYCIPLEVLIVHHFILFSHYPILFCFIALDFLLLIIPNSYYLMLFYAVVLLLLMLLLLIM